MILLFVAALFGFSTADSHSKPYVDGEEVILWVNKVGPFRNPQETYKFYSLPYCKPETEVETTAEGLGEALQGYELMKSAVVVRYTRDVNLQPICSKVLSAAEIQQFKNAIKDRYWFQLFMDDLPIWGMVGEYDAANDKYKLFTHKALEIHYNNDRIIKVTLAGETPVELTGDSAEITFTYSVHWVPTSDKYEERFDHYLDDHFFKHQIHWFSVFNSFMMVVFLVGLVAMIL